MIWLGTELTYLVTDVIDIAAGLESDTCEGLYGFIFSPMLYPCRQHNSDFPSYRILVERSNS